MIVCQLDENGYFVGTTEADESPLEPGVFLLPAGTIKVSPPALVEGKLAKWNGTEFILVDMPVPREDPKLEQVPVCSPWQIRKALNLLGLRQQLEEIVKVSEDINLKDGWEFATEFRSDDQFVLLMGSSLGKSEEETVELIKLASTL